MGLIKSLEQITAADQPLVGGKAYNCARLKQSGFPVPDGFVVLANAPDSLIATVEFQDALMRLPAKTLFAVRSSAADEDGAAHSFAGIHETKLNVESEGLRDAIGACRASVESTQALAYRRAQGLSVDRLQTGVLVQVMIRAVVSGVAFTINPVTGARDELVISASWGLGEALVGGHVEPDEFRVRKSDGTLLSSHIGGKLHRVISEQGVSRLVETDRDERTRPSLTEAQLCELAALLLRVEEHYNSAQDVEWCHDGVQFWIVQSRPVTATQEVSPSAPQTARHDIEWTRANAREVLPDLPSPQVLFALCDILDRGMRAYSGNLLAPEAELGPTIKAFYGRPYFNLSQFRHICRMTGSDMASVLRGVGHEGEINPEDELATRPALKDFLRVLPAMLRAGWMQLRAGVLVRQELARVAEDMALLNSRDPRTLTDEEIAAFLQKWNDEAAERLQIVFVMTAVTIYEAPLKKICERVGFPYEKLLHTYLATGEKSVSAQQGFDLLTLANLARGEEVTREYFMRSNTDFKDFRSELQGTEFLVQFELFLEKYGHRGPYESDWSLPRYSEDPQPLLFAVSIHVQAPDCPAPEAIIARQDREAAATWQAFTKRLNWWQRLFWLPLVSLLLKRAKRMYVWRELCRSEMMRPPSAIRHWLLTMADRFVERGWIEYRDDFFFLTREETAAGLGQPEAAAQFRSIVAARKAEIEVWRQFEMPLLMRESELPALIKRRANKDDLVLAGTNVKEEEQQQLPLLHGLCVSAGYAEGEVLVMRDPAEFARMKRGVILVAPATDPAWTPLFTLASGIIVEVGGTLSHASTVAREYGLPALANLKDATKILKDGDRVQLDATNGTVQIVSRKTTADA